MLEQAKKYTSCIQLPLKEELGTDHVYQSHRINIHSPDRFVLPQISKRLEIAPSEDTTTRSPSAFPPGPCSPAPCPFNCIPQ